MTADTTVCDTLLPYRWRDTLFTEPARYEIVYQDKRGCDSLLCILQLDTVRCERLWALILNKYDWLVLLDNVKLRQYFPGRTAIGFQWFKDGVAIPGATDDDYSEQNILNGRFQLRITLDGGEDIWSNILEIVHPEEEEPLHVRVYDSRGREVREECMHQGVYLFHYQQGDRSWTEKRLIR